MRILVSAYTGLGNFILKTPMISKLKELWPEAQIDLLIGKGYGAEFVLDGANIIKETHCLNIDASLSDKLNFFLSLRKKRFDAVFLPLDAAPKRLMFGSLLIGGTKFAHINLNRHRNMRQRIWNLIYLSALPGFRFVPWLRGRHEIDLNYDLLEAFYDRPMERTYRTFIAHKDSPEVLTRFKLFPRQYIVLQPSAANGSLTAKVWAPKNFEELVRRIHQQYHGLKVVFVGDQGDLEVINKTVLADIDGVVNTMGHTSISELSTVINNAAIVIAHDSGVMHIANALQVNLIALYGPTDYTCTRPLGESSHILYSRNACFAAHYNLDVTESDLAKQYPDYECMDGISVDDVIQKINELLAVKHTENSIA